MFKKVILAALVVTSAVFAQFNVNVGGRAAANFGTFVGDDAKELDMGWGVGFNAGVAAKLDVLPILSVVGGLEADLRRASQKKTEESYGGDLTTETSLNMWYLDIPVVARFNVVPMFHVDAGVVLAFKLASSATVEISQGGQSVSSSADFDFVKAFDAAVTAGIGASVIPGMLDVDFRFVYSLTNWPDYAGVDVGIKHMRMQVGATYWFM